MMLLDEKIQSSANENIIVLIQLDGIPLFADLFNSEL